MDSRVRGGEGGKEKLMGLAHSHEVLMFSCKVNNHYGPSRALQNTSVRDTFNYTDGK